MNERTRRRKEKNCSLIRSCRYTHFVTCRPKCTCKIAAHAIYGDFFFFASIVRRILFYSFFAFANDFYMVCLCAHTHTLHIHLVSLFFAVMHAVSFPLQQRQNFRKATTRRSKTEPSKSIVIFVGYFSAFAKCFVVVYRHRTEFVRYINRNVRAHRLWQALRALYKQNAKCCKCDANDVATV